MDIGQIRKDVHAYYHSIFNDKYGRYVRILELFPPIKESDCILDYGCGTGCVSQYFYNKYKCKVDAVEQSEIELTKVKISFQGGVKWMTIHEFSFPELKYDLVFSSQVIEHVHNVGNYLCRINRMLKSGGCLIISLPNIINPNFIWGTFFISTDRLRRHSMEMLSNYNKVHNHINAWDAYNFVTLLASCGFEMEAYLPIEGVAQPYFIWKRIPIIGKWLPAYTNKKNRGKRGNWSYTMSFRFKKVREACIENYD